jgi:tetratricopeptide (TPR) repeat protein
MKPIAEVVALWQQRSDDIPLDYLSRTELGRALSRQAREEADLRGYEQAEMVLLEALALNPSYRPARLALASALSSQHRFTEAREIAEAVYAEDRSSLSALVLSGDASFELGDYERAEAVYAEIAALEGSAPIVARLARMAWVRGDLDGAVALSGQALDLSEDYALRPHDAAFYWFQLGHFRFVNGDTAGAVDALDQALLVAPDHPGAAEEMAHVQASLGNTAVAEQLYRDLLAKAPAADLHGLYADLLVARGDEVGAAVQEQLGLDLAVRTIAAFPAERRHLVGFYVRRDSTVALELAEADLGVRRDVGAFDTLAWALYHAGRPLEAAEAMATALTQGTVGPSLMYHAGAIAAAVGDTETAREHLRTALDLNPRFDPIEAPAAAALLGDLG